MKVRKAPHAKRDGDVAGGEFETECPGYCGAQDTFYVGTLKGVGRIYQQTYIDTYAKVAFAKLYDRKTPITAADLLNDRVLPFDDEYGVVLERVLTDRGTEFCGTHDRHEYELYLAVETIDHTRTKAKTLRCPSTGLVGRRNLGQLRPQTNGGACRGSRDAKHRGTAGGDIVERMHKTMLDEFYRIAVRKTLYQTIDALQADLDARLKDYNTARSHQGRYCFGKTPMQTFLDAAATAPDKQIAEQTLAPENA